MSTVVRIEKRQRSAVGQIVKWTFIAFNVLMLLWLVSGLTAVSQMTPDSDAGRAGHAIGSVIGLSMVLGFWVMGDVILGLFVMLTRGNTTIVEETTRGYRDREDTAEKPNSEALNAAVSRYNQRQDETKSARVATPSKTTEKGTFGRRGPSSR